MTSISLIICSFIILSMNLIINLRNTELGFKTNYARTELFRSSYSPRVARLWNNLPISSRKRESLSMFKEVLRLYCFAIDSINLMLLIFNFSQY